MKEFAIDAVPQYVAALFEAAPQQRVLITRDGKPVAMVVRLENKYAEDAAWESSPDFREMIEERRSRPIFPLSEAEGRLFDQASG